MQRIAMWSGPRNISSAMMRSWGNRPDTVVCDEPLYAHYLLKTSTPHPGADEVMRSQSTNWRAVARMLTAIHRRQDMKVISEMLMMKLYGSNAQQMIAKLALELIPDAGLREPGGGDVVMGVGAFTEGRWVSNYMFSLALTIAGGTSNVQRNIIGERVLGLPRDQRPS